MDWVPKFVFSVSTRKQPKNGFKANSSQKQLTPFFNFAPFFPHYLVIFQSFTAPAAAHSTLKNHFSCRILIIHQIQDAFEIFFFKNILVQLALNPHAFLQKSGFRYPIIHHQWHHDYYRGVLLSSSSSIVVVFAPLTEFSPLEGRKGRSRNGRKAPPDDEEEPVGQHNPT